MRGTKNSMKRLLFVPSLRVLSPRDRVIRALALSELANVRIVSVFGSFEPHIPRGSFLRGAANVRHDTGGHFRILRHPRIVSVFAQLANRSPEPQRPH